MVWMLTAHKGFIRSILDGEKTVEVRTRIPYELNVGDVLLFCQSGNGNNVSLRAYVGGIIKTTPGILFENFYRQIQLNYLAFDDYTKIAPWVYGIMLSSVEPMTCPTSLFGIDKNPQWFRRVNSRFYEQRTQINDTSILTWNKI